MERQLADLLDDSGNDDLADMSFIKKASAFLVAQRIVSKSFVDYVGMAQELDNEILKDFIDQIVDQIVVLDGRVQSITFINGLNTNSDTDAGGVAGVSEMRRTYRFNVRLSDKDVRFLRKALPANKSQRSARHAPREEESGLPGMFRPGRTLAPLEL